MGDIDNRGDQDIRIRGLVSSGNYPADVDSQNRLKVKTTIAVGEVTGVGENYGWDNFPSGWVELGGTIVAGDWVKITINGYDSQYTIQSGDTWKDIVDGLVAVINNNSDVNSSVDAYPIYNRIVYIRGEYVGDEFLDVTLTASVSGSITATVDSHTIDNNNKLDHRWKEILIEEDVNDRRRGWLSITGEVGSRTKAENPIHLCIRKSLATKNEVIFTDTTVPSERKWYITNVAVADDLGAEFRIYHGIERDRIEYFSGDGNENTFTLDYNAIALNDYIVVKVNGETKTLGDDYNVEQNAEDSTKSDIVFDNAPPTGSDNIEITYDAVHLNLGLFVQSSSSQTFEFGAPIKLEPGEFIIASVVNKSANAGIVILNLNGFYEEVYT